MWNKGKTRKKNSSIVCNYLLDWVHPGKHETIYATPQLGQEVVYKVQTSKQKQKQNKWTKASWKLRRKMWPTPQTCSRPPLKSMDIFGVDCSGPGLPLCLHHLASRLTVAQHGPIRIRFLSLRLVLSRKSFMLSRNDDPRITPRENKRGVHIIIIPCQKICLSKNYLHF